MDPFRDELTAVAGKLAVVGLILNLRKAGLRVAKLKDMRRTQDAPKQAPRALPPRELPNGIE